MKNKSNGSPVTIHNKQIELLLIINCWKHRPIIAKFEVYIGELLVFIGGNKQLTSVSVGLMDRVLQTFQHTLGVN